MVRQCAWCKKLMGRTKGKVTNPAFYITHGICPVCFDREMKKLRASEVKAEPCQVSATANAAGAGPVYA